MERALLPGARMIRIAQPDGWILVEHRDHARLAGDLARHWGNSDFAPPEPRDDILVAVTRHDDAWAERDARPTLTREGRPSAFSQELVGAYSAFEEMDFAEYLAVRGRATETVAAENPYAAILISMHTVNLLTQQADLTTLGAAQRTQHQHFIDHQLERQRELAAQVAADPARHEEIGPERLQRAFEFLQACDSLSLIACVRFPREMPLRHQHPDRGGVRRVLSCQPLGGGAYRVTPYPFSTDELRLSAPCRRIRSGCFADVEEFRAAHRTALVDHLKVRIVR